MLYLFYRICAVPENIAIATLFFTGKIMENKPESLVQLKRYVASRIADRWHDVGIQLLFTTEELDKTVVLYQLKCGVRRCCTYGYKETNS